MLLYDVAVKWNNVSKSLPSESSTRKSIIIDNYTYKYVVFFYVYIVSSVHFLVLFVHVQIRPKINKMNTCLVHLLQSGWFVSKSLSLQNGTQVCSEDALGSVVWCVPECDCGVLICQKTNTSRVLIRHAKHCVCESTKTFARIVLNWNM